MHPMNYKQRLFASMASGPMVPFAPDPEEGGAGDEGAGDDPAAGGADEGAGEGEEAPAAEGEAGGAEAGAEEPPKPARVPWQVKRIDKLSGELKGVQEERDRFAREAEESRRRVAAYEALYGKDGAPAAGGEAPAPVPTTEPGKRVYTEDELQQEVTKRANLHALNGQLDQMYETGKKDHGKDFETRVLAAGQAFPDLARRVDFFQAMAKLPNGPDVYHNLTGDLDRMGDVLEMSPLELGMELARMSQEVANKPRGPAVSRAPAPIDPIDTSGGAGTKGDAMTEHAKDFETRQAKRRERNGY